MNFCFLIEITMNKILILLIFLFSFSSVYSSELNSIIKILVSSQNRNCYAPWRRGPTENRSGSGFVIKGGIIITNAHVVRNATTIVLVRMDKAKQYNASVKFISNECDLACLIPDDATFFDGLSELELGNMPELNDQVVVIGYPAGGEKISFTAGIISRLEYETYVQDGYAMNFVFQTDAAINPGNSGGPVIKDGKVVGVAFQAQSNLQNVGYFIPYMVLKHFLDDISDGKYDGFPKMGLLYANMQNPIAREYYGITGEIGVIVRDIAKNSPMKRYIKKNDVILSMAGIPIGIDGKIESRWGRINKDFIIKNRYIGDTIEIVFKRNKKLYHNIVKLNTYLSSIRKSHRYNEDYPYFSCGGYIFQPLSRDYLQTWGKKWYLSSPALLRYYYEFFNTSEDDREGLVVLSRILPLEINQDFGDMVYSVVKEVNGKRVFSFDQFKELMKKSIKDKKREYIVITFEDNYSIPLIIPKNMIEKADQNALKYYQLPLEVE